MKITMRLSCRSTAAITATAIALGIASDSVSAQSRDSAGVRIVESQRPLGPPGAARRLSAAPTVVIGNQTGETYELSRVAGAARLTDGTIVVADGATMQLRYFDAQGRFLRAVGRPGQGPGEFQKLEVMTRLAGDTLLAGVRFRGSRSIFTGPGTFVRVLSPLAPGAEIAPGIPVLLGAFDDQATVIGAVPGGPPDARSLERGFRSFPLYIVSRSGTTVRPLGEFPDMTVANASGPSMVRLAPHAAYASSGREFFYGFGREYSIHVYSPDGALKRIIRRQWTPPKIASAEIDRYADAWSRRWITSAGAAAEQERREFRASPFSEILPAFAQFVADRSGNLWVREAKVADAGADGSYTTQPLVASTWNVFDTQGRWTMNVTMPARFSPTEIGADYVLGIARDADGVETVVMYRLE